MGVGPKLGSLAVGGLEGSPLLLGGTLSLLLLGGGDGGGALAALGHAALSVAAAVVSAHDLVAGGAEVRGGAGANARLAVALAMARTVLRARAQAAVGAGEALLALARPLLGATPAVARTRVGADALFARASSELGQAQADAAGLTEAAGGLFGVVAVLGARGLLGRRLVGFLLGLGGGLLGFLLLVLLFGTVGANPTLVALAVNALLVDLASTVAAAVIGAAPVGAGDTRIAGVALARALLALAVNTLGADRVGAGFSGKTSEALALAIDTVALFVAVLFAELRLKVRSLLRRLWGRWVNVRWNYYWCRVVVGWHNRRFLSNCIAIQVGLTLAVLIDSNRRCRKQDSEDKQLSAQHCSSRVFLVNMSLWTSPRCLRVSP